MRDRCRDQKVRGVQRNRSVRINEVRLHEADDEKVTPRGGDVGQAGEDLDVELQGVPALVPRLLERLVFFERPVLGPHSEKRPCGDHALRLLALHEKNERLHGVAGFN